MFSGRIGSMMMGLFLAASTNTTVNLRRKEKKFFVPRWRPTNESLIINYIPYDRFEKWNIIFFDNSTFLLSICECLRDPRLMIMLDALEMFEALIKNIFILSIPKPLFASFRFRRQKINQFLDENVFIIIMMKNLKW